MLRLLPITVGLFAVIAAAEPPPAPSVEWAQWRGPLGTGVAPQGQPPIEWSETKNVRWKTPIPGRGLSSPVVWGDRVFLTTAIPTGDAVAAPAHESHGAHDNVPSARRQRFVLLALDRRDGRVLWERTVREERPHESVHATGSWASASAVTDGERVYASFGSAGIYALTVAGEPVWNVDLGDMQSLHGHGEGSSPALADGSLIVNWDHEGDSFVTALDAKTGKERWRVARDEPTSWSTPLVVEHGGKKQVVIAATHHIRGYDLKDGRLLWTAPGLSTNVVASPVSADGLVIAGSSYDFQAMRAIRLGLAKGNVTEGEAIAWTRDRDTPYVPSPVLYDGTLCFLKHLSAVLTCVEAKTGRTLLGPRRLGELRNVYASLVVAAGRLYAIDRDGSAVVLEFGGEFRELARNKIAEGVSSSPAIVGDTLYVRGERHLYALAAESGP